MESWSTYKTQCSDCAHGGQEVGGGEGENDQIGMEMRGQEIKRKNWGRRGMGGSVHIFVHAIFFFPELRYIFFFPRLFL